MAADISKLARESNCSVFVFRWMEWVTAKNGKDQIP